MPSIVRVRVYDSRIQGMFEPPGDVWQFARRLGRDTVRIGQTIGPKRSMTLINSLDFAVTPVPMGAITTARATAEHSLFVILGTGRYNQGGVKGTRILPRYKRAMRLSPGGGYPTLVRRSVEGQVGNNFLDEAKRIALALHGVD